MLTKNQPGTIEELKAALARCEAENLTLKKQAEAPVERLRMEKVDEASASVPECQFLSILAAAGFV